MSILVREIRCFTTDFDVGYPNHLLEFELHQNLTPLLYLPNNGFQNSVTSK